MVIRNAATVLFLLSLWQFPAQAAALTYIGALDPQNPNDVLVVPLNLGAASNVTIRTYSYGGGVTETGAIVSAGSFDPTVTLFVGSGPGAIFPALDFFNDDGTCPPANVDPATLLCLDSVLNLKYLPAGVYTAVLTVAGNIPLAVAVGSGTLGSGFSGGGIYDEPPISSYAFDIVTTSVPEPATITLFSLAAASLYVRKRVARQQNDRTAVELPLNTRC